MKRTLLFAVALITLCSLSAQATDYVYVSANGDTTAASMTSGDTLSFGCNVNDRSMRWEVAIDSDHSGTITPGDKFMVGFQQFDQDNWFLYGYPDSDTALGWIRFDLGVAGLAPGCTYILKATDHDGSFAYDTLLVQALAVPDVVVSGTIGLTGVTPPDGRLANILVEVSPEGQPGGFWNTLTDSVGNYTITVDSIGLGLLYHLGPTDQIFPYVVPDGETLTLAGSLLGKNYLYQLASAKVVGSVLDDLGGSLPQGLNMNVESQPAGKGKNVTLSEPGHYFVCFGDSELGQWTIGLTPYGLLPYYLMPASQDVSLGPGDSIEVNFVAYRADTIVAGKVTIMDTVPIDTVHFMVADCELPGVGMGIAFCDSLTGAYEIGVNSADTLTYRVAIDAPAGPRLPGFVVEEGFVRFGVQGGDTVNFNFVPATDTIGGAISFDFSVPPGLRFPLQSLTILSWYWKTPGFPLGNIAAFGMPDPMGNYWIPSEPDTYGIFCINFPDTNYYTQPYYYDSLIIDGDTDTLDFVIFYKGIGVSEWNLGTVAARKPELSDCRPNPFLDGTVVRANVPSGMGNSNPSLCVYDIGGRLVKVLSRGETGDISLYWDGKDTSGKDVSSGIYFIKLQGLGPTITRKAVLLR